MSDDSPVRSSRRFERRLQHIDDDDDDDGGDNG